MSVQDLCQICESKPATRTCDNCGTAACGDHFDENRGLCARCVASLEGADDVETPDSGEKDDVGTTGHGGEGEDDVGGGPLR